MLLTPRQDAEQHCFSQERPLLRPPLSDVILGEYPLDGTQKLFGIVVVVSGVWKMRRGGGRLVDEAKRTGTFGPAATLT